MTLKLKAAKWEMEMLKDAMQKTMTEMKQQIRKETGAKYFETYGIYQDETIVQGFFKTNTGREGSFSFCKSLVPALVVNVYE